MGVFQTKKLLHSKEIISKVKRKPIGLEKKKLQAMYLIRDDYIKNSVAK